MIRLDNIKAVFYDFDDTLCIHANRNVNASRTDYWRELLTQGHKYYDCPSDSVGLGMKQMIEDCKARGIEQYIITWASSNAKYKPVLDWCAEHFGEDTFIDCICVSKYKYKVDYIKAFTEAKGLFTANVLLVDDYFRTLDYADKNNIKVATPQMIALEYGRE